MVEEPVDCGDSIVVDEAMRIGRETDAASKGNDAFLFIPASLVVVCVVLCAGVVLVDADCCFWRAACIRALRLLVADEDTRGGWGWGVSLLGLVITVLDPDTIGVAPDELGGMTLVGFSFFTPPVTTWRLM